MFDTDYNYSFSHNSEYATLMEDIENDLYCDINSLLSNFNRLYNKDKFKCRGYNIDIVYPQYYYPEFKTALKRPDSVRSLLSMYPAREDLSKIRSIILKPRHIEIDGTELISLYIRREKILVMYLHHPHLYTVNSLKFRGLSDISRTGLFNPAGTNKDGKSLIMQIPALWYILSVITYSLDDKIEKFLVRRDDKACKAGNAALKKISDISFHYSRLGY